MNCTDYKHLFDSIVKLVGVYQDEVVPQLIQALEENGKDTDVPTNATDNNVGRWISVEERLATA